MKNAFTVSTRSNRLWQTNQMKDPNEIFAFVMKNLAPFSDVELEVFFKTLFQESFKPGEFYVQIGEKSDKVGFVLSGLFKTYALSHEGAKHILNFCEEGFFIGSLASLITNLPSHVSIEAIEPSVVFSTSYSNLANLYKTSLNWQQFGRKIAEKLYLEREQREYEALALSAEERWNRLLERYPNIDKRVSQGELAVAIGITPTSLSRLLKKSKKVVIG
ncbi:MAG: Crp/Fnr family transcriptional regulator [Pseudobdellovibrionaceae bacterium]